MITKTKLCYDCQRVSYIRELTTIGDGTNWRDVCDECLARYNKCRDCGTTICGDGYRVFNEDWVCDRCLLMSYRLQNEIRPKGPKFARY